MYSSCKQKIKDNVIFTKRIIYVNQKGRHNIKDTEVEGGIILKFIFNKFYYSWATINWLVGRILLGLS